MITVIGLVILLTVPMAVVAKGTEERCNADESQVLEKKFEGVCRMVGGKKVFSVFSSKQILVNGQNYSCHCNYGLHRHQNGSCLPWLDCVIPNEVDCKQGQLPVQNDIRCELSCWSSLDARPRDCPTNETICRCAPGYVRLYDKCVFFYDCSKLLCSANETLALVRKECDPTCADRRSVQQRLKEQPYCVDAYRRCICAPGMVRPGSGSSECIPEEKCPQKKETPIKHAIGNDQGRIEENTKKIRGNKRFTDESSCARGETPVQNSMECERSCWHPPNSEIPNCPTRETICRCAHGYVRSPVTNECVPQSTCSQLLCLANETLGLVTEECEPTCKDPRSAELRIVDNPSCAGFYRKCICALGMVRPERGSLECIPVEKCPQKRAPININIAIDDTAVGNDAEGINASGNDRKEYHTTIKPAPNISNGLKDLKLNEPICARGETPVQNSMDCERSCWHPPNSEIPNCPTRETICRCVHGYVRSPVTNECVPQSTCNQLLCYENEALALVTEECEPTCEDQRSAQQRITANASCVGFYRKCICASGMVRPERGRVECVPVEKCPRKRAPVKDAIHIKEQYDAEGQHQPDMIKFIPNGELASFVGDIDECVSGDCAQNDLPRKNAVGGGSPRSDAATQTKARNGNGGQLHSDMFEFISYPQMESARFARDIAECVGDDCAQNNATSVVDASESGAQVNQALDDYALEDIL